MAKTSRVIQLPAGPQPVIPVPLIPGTIWAVQSDDFGNAFGDEYWFGDGTQTSTGTQVTPDSDYNWAIGDLGGAQTFPTYPAGGSDGTNIYRAVMSEAGQWYVDVFDRDDSELLGRWTLTDWDSSGYVSGTDPYLFQQSTIQHLTAGPTRVVVICDYIDPNAILGPVTGGETEIWVAVFDIETETMLNNFHIPVGFDVDFGNYDFITINTGSCLDAAETHVYFAMNSHLNSDDYIVSVNLETGELAWYFDLTDFNNTVSAEEPLFDLDDIHGIIEIDGDFIITGGGVARVQANGTPVWWNIEHLPAEEFFLDDTYAGIAHSGRESFWASHAGTGIVDEFTYDGTFLQSITVPEPAMHAWLVGFTEPIGQSQVLNTHVKTATVINTSRVRSI